MQSGLFASKKHIHEGGHYEKTRKELKIEIEETQVKITQLEHCQQILESRMRYLKQKDRKQIPAKESTSFVLS